jgi:serine/threonine protein kinase
MFCHLAASQGTMTHMAPEVMLVGKLSRGSDVYAFGVLLWELFTAQHAFKGIPRALLGHEVAHRQRRPQFPEGSPFDYQLLACRWALFSNLFIHKFLLYSVNYLYNFL